MRILVRFLSLLLLLTIGATIFFETKTGQEKLVRFLTHQIEEKCAVRCHIKRIHCFLPFYVQIQGISVETKKGDSLLNASQMTLLPIPIPLSKDSVILPYVQLQSFHLHLQALSKLSSQKNKTNFFISIPSLHLLNGKANDPSLPTPYTFSFDGGTKIENDTLFIEGELLDQTSILPLHKARGQIQIKEGIPQGWIQCSFKNESILNDFRSLFVQFDTKGFSGSWKLDTHPSSARVSSGLIVASLEGVFNIAPASRKWFIDCTAMTLNPRFESRKFFPWLPEYFSGTTCTGSWRIEGAIEQNLLTLQMQRFFLSSTKQKIQCDGKISYFLDKDDILLSTSLSGDIATQETDSTFTLQCKGKMNAFSKDLVGVFSSPFARSELIWHKTEKEEKASFYTHIQNLSLEPDKHLFKSLTTTCTYDSTQEVPLSAHFHIDRPTFNQCMGSSIDIQATFTSIAPLDGSLEIRVENGKYQDFSLSVGKALFEWRDNLQYGTVFLKGAKRRIPWNIAASGTLHKKDGNFHFECSQLEGQVGSHTFSLRSEAIGSFNPLSGIKELNFNMRFGQEGFLSLTHNAGFRNTLILTFDQCPLSPFFLFFAKQDLSGHIGGKLMYTYGGKFPELHGQMTFDYTAYKDLPHRDARTIEGHSLITTRLNEISLGMQIKEIEEERNLELRGIIPILPSTTFPFAIVDYDSPFEARLQGTTTLSSLLAPFHDNSIIFQGNLSINNMVQGTLTSPLMSGEIHLEEGAFVIPRIDGLIQHIAADGTFFGSECIINSLKGCGEKGGSLHGSALLRFQNGSFVWNMNTFFSNMKLVDLPSMAMEGTGSILLEGTPQTVTIHGDAKLMKGTIDLAKAAPNYAPIRQQKANTQSSILYDIRLEADKTLTIKGRSFSTLWSGKGTLTGTSSQPTIDLTSRCDSGYLLFGGKKMAVEKGTLDIHGSYSKDSKLEVTAIAPLPQCTARLLLKGPLTRLKVFLRSSPQRSEKEILSLLLFDKELIAISPFESLQLANAALSLEKKSAGSTLFDTVKDEFGIDTINIGSSGPDSDDMTLTVGKYISKGVAVTLSKDISSEANRVGLEVDVTREIKANAMVGDDESAILSLTWKKEF